MHLDNQLKDLIFNINPQFEVALFYSRTDQFDCIYSNIPSYSQNSCYTIYSMIPLVRALLAKGDLLPENELFKMNEMEKILCRIVEWTDVKKVVFIDFSPLSSVVELERIESVLKDSNLLDGLFGGQI